ncbi:hypothetical protein [Lactococcus garvieae]
MKETKKELKVGILSIVIIALIIVIGGKMYMKNKENENLENQRTAAIGFKNVQPGVEEIKFVEQGSRSGAGIWSVGVDVIIDGKKYDEIFVKNGLSGGEELPEGNSGTKGPVKVIYSNGKEEIIE